METEAVDEESLTGDNEENQYTHVKSQLSVLAEMGTNTGHVMTLANSIIGVSVLAMPFCFKQCGIILATLMLIASSIMSRLACYYLIKSSILARRRNFEFLAFHMFGPTGKLTVELSIIGFMLGTCVAFFVVMGDLGPAIIGPMLHIENASSIRASVLIAIAVFVVLPLGLLRNVDSLSAISAATIAFYICLVLKVTGEATTHLLSWDWLDKVHFWRPAGLLQCIPIFSMALSCQTQLFEIFDSIPNATLDKMNVIVRSAVNLCTLMYISMGFFGYIAFCTQPFSGNLMLSFSPTPTSEVIKMGFVLSVAVSFPLVIFPCRASLHSLLFRRGAPPHYELLSVSNHMSEGRFKVITLVIVAVSLVTGVLIPNIELVLGLVGSTIGVLICVIIPATLFLKLTTKNNNERLLAQILFGMGVLIMVLGSYANLYATEEAVTGNEAVLAPANAPVLPNLNLPLPQHDINPKVEIKDDALKNMKNVEELAAALPKLMKDTPADTPVVKVEEKADVRKEPPVPEAPVVKVVSEAPVQAKNEEELPKSPPEEEIKKENPPPVVLIEPAKKNDNQKKEEVIHNDAIQKEDDEIKEVQKQNILKKKEELIEKLEETEQKQQKLLEEQQKILQDIKKEKEKLVKEGEQLKELDKLPVKEVKLGDNQGVENEVVEKEKRRADVEPKQEINVNNNILTVIKESKVESDAKLNPANVMKNDNIVKKNMAEGVPLPIAIQNFAPNVEAVKSAKIVDNPANPNEGNADSKALRREILEQGEMKEQREKRDIEEVKEVDLRETNNSVKEKVVPENTDTIVEVKENIDLQKEDPLKSAEEHRKHEIVEKDDRQFNTLSVDRQKENLPNEKAPAEDCLDEKKPNNARFSDNLKPLREKERDLERNNTPSKEKSLVQLKTEKTEVKSTVSKIIKESTESIIKAPNYLSNPGLVLPGDEKLQVENNALSNAAKPMKRDLKSIQSENKKESET